MAPSTPGELREMLELALKLNKPVAIRYPKGPMMISEVSESPVNLGKAAVLRQGKDLAIISIGSMASTALETGELLAKKKIDAMVVNARFIKPLDEELLERISTDIKKIVTIEDGVLEGGFGSAVLEFMEREGLRGVKVRRFGLPDKFIEHGRRQELFLKYNLTPEAICDVIINEVIK